MNFGDIKEFLILELSRLNVKDKDKLQEYVDFCLDNSLEEQIKFKSNLHHILPKAKSLPFINYKNLKEHSWNGVHLLHKDHFIAHSILAEAISDKAISHAWHRMNITTDDFDKKITPELYQILCEEHKMIVSSAHLGKKRSEETKLKISNSLAGRKLSKEHVEKMKSVIRTEEQKNNLREKCSGRKHTSEEIEKQIKAQSGKEQTKVQCPHCTQTGGLQSMKRWHFDNCKLNPLLTEETKKKFLLTCPHCGLIGGHNAMKRHHFDNCKRKNT